MLNIVLITNTAHQPMLFQPHHLIHTTHTHTASSLRDDDDDDDLTIRNIIRATSYTYNIHMSNLTTKIKDLKTIKRNNIPVLHVGN